MSTLLAAILGLYVIPAGAAILWWSTVEKPASWRNASWAASGVLPSAGDDGEAAIHVLSARTGGLKGALSVHSWIVTKEEGAPGYNRYDKVGWGSPIRQNAYAADGFWFSNQPTIEVSLRGEEAARLIPKIEAAIAAYPYARYGGYKIWPGPNSNTFVAHVLRAVPELGIALPATAVGRDYPSEGRLFSLDHARRQISASAWGYAGFTAGTGGIEVNFLGLVSGIDFKALGIKLPGVGLLALRG